MYLFCREALRANRVVRHECIPKSSSRSSSAAMIGRLQSGRCTITECTALAIWVITSLPPPPPGPFVAPGGPLTAASRPAGVMSPSSDVRS